MLWGLFIGPLMDTLKGILPKQKRMNVMRQGHKTLISMIDSAEKRGFSKRGNWLVEYNVYKDTDTGKWGTYDVYHWGTLLLTIKERQKTIQHSHTYQVTYVYGESVSDARGINAVLDYFGIGGIRYTYKPVNGGFQEVHK